MIVTAIMTCGRGDVFERTLASLDEQVSGPITREVIFDDSGDRAYRLWLEEIADRRGASVMSWGENLGYTMSMFYAWRWLRHHATEPYVFHVEDDFTFDRPVDLTELVKVLELEPALAEVVLLRHAYYPREIRAGGIVEEHPEAYTRQDREGLTWLEHELFFSTNPGLYARDLVRRHDWPRKHRNSEAVMGPVLVGEGRRFAFLGDGTPQITHIGDERGGHGY